MLSSYNQILFGTISSHICNVYWLAEEGKAYLTDHEVLQKMAQSVSETFISDRQAPRLTLCSQERETFGSNPFPGASTTTNSVDVIRPLRLLVLWIELETVQKSMWYLELI